MKWFRVTAKLRRQFAGYGANGRYYLSGKPVILPESEVQGEITNLPPMFTVEEIEPGAITESDDLSVVKELGLEGELPGLTAAEPAQEEAVDDTPAEEEAVDEVSPDPEPSRKELEAQAAELGIDTSRMRLKAEVRAAIESAQAGA